MENRVINAAILGAGTVGGGVYKLAQAMEEDIFHKTGARLVIKKMLVRNVNKERKGIPSEILTDDWNSIINDPEIDIIVELMGGTPKMSLDAAAIIFKNVLGLVCDPVAGLVEIPCAKRNVSGAINALCTADMVMAGVNSKIPFDDAVAVFANGRLYRYHLYIYVSDDVEAFKQYETSLKECHRRWDRVARRKPNSLPPKSGGMPEKKEISSKAGM